MSDDVAMRVRVTGRVQGVWFRGWTEAEARRLGLRGWVRNLPDGAVLALLTGPKVAVSKMIAALHHGPDHAKVVSVDVEPAEDEVPAGFSVLR